MRVTLDEPKINIIRLVRGLRLVIAVCAPALQIAADLDASEQALLSEGGVDSEDYLRYIAEGSGNVADDGMFSVQARHSPSPGGRAAWGRSTT